MYLSTVLTHEITVFNQPHRIAAKIPLRPTWILYRLGTIDANNSILFLDQFLLSDDILIFSMALLVNDKITGFVAFVANLTSFVVLPQPAAS